MEEGIVINDLGLLLVCIILPLTSVIPLSISKKTILDRAFSPNCTKEDTLDLARLLKYTGENSTVPVWLQDKQTDLSARTIIATACGMRIKKCSKGSLEEVASRLVVFLIYMLKELLKKWSDKRGRGHSSFKDEERVPLNHAVALVIR